jgi:hypothetical protein
MILCYSVEYALYGKAKQGLDIGNPLVTNQLMLPKVPLDLTK